MISGEKLFLWEEGRVPGYNHGIPQSEPYITAVLTERSLCRGSILVCPGGCYSGHYGPEGEPVAKWLNSIGFAAFVLSYRVAPYQFPWPLADAQRALRAIRFNAERWGIPEKPLGIIGSSAGGHLACMTGIFHNDSAVPRGSDEIDKAECRPDFMILCYPVITFGKHRHNDSMLNLLGENATEAMRHKFSLENSVLKDTSPAFVWHTVNDELVPVENSLLLAGALRNHNVPFSLHIFPEGRHGLGVTGERPDVAKWTALCEDWLERWRQTGAVRTGEGSQSRR
jgi:acetyl esterase/lipase